MCRKEENIENNILSLYSDFRVITRNSERGVYVALYKPLGLKRVIKYVSKDSILSDYLRSEADILRSIKHPNIPAIFDFTEDEHFLYIIEEYIDGITLKEYILKYGSLKEKYAAEFILKLCNIIRHLHELEPDPVIFLDLQPENIIINNHEPYLIDFGNACFLKNIKKRRYIFGTPGFAAPEQYSGIPETEKSDVYSMGAIIKYVVSGDSDSMRMLTNIGEAAMENDSSLRYENIGDLIKDLEKITHKVHNLQSSVRICVTGSSHGVGITHTALALTNSLAENIKNICYVDAEGTFLENLICVTDKCRLFGEHYRYNNCSLRFYYDGDISPFQVEIADMGVYDKEKDYGDYVIFVTGGRIWEAVTRSDMLEFIKRKEVIVVYNHVCDDGYAHLRNLYGVAGFTMPYCENPFKPDKETKIIMKNIACCFQAIRERVSFTENKDKSKKGKRKLFKKRS